jgi:hypothetical protein
MAPAMDMTQGAYTQVVKMIEEAQLRGQIDLHGYTVKDAISGIDVILDVLGASSKDSGLPVGFGWVEWGQGRVHALAGTHTLVAEVGSLGGREGATGAGGGGAHFDGSLPAWETPGSEGGRSPSGGDPGFLIVTGRGLHSKGASPVVKPAIESKCRVTRILWLVSGVCRENDAIVRQWCV